MQKGCRLMSLGRKMVGRRYWRGARKSGPSVAWSPSDEANLHLWFKADAGVTTDVDGVSVWADQSGNGGNLVRNATTDSPTKSTAAFGGAETIYFSSDILLQNTTYPLKSDTLFIVIQFDSDVDNTSGAQYICSPANSTQVWLGVGSTTVAVAGEVICIGSGTNQRDGISNGNIASIPSSSGHILGVIFGTRYEMYYDGSDDLRDLAANTTVAWTANSASGGVGGQGTSNKSLAGHIAEIVCYSDSKSSTVRQKIEGYLAHRWGLAGNLPSGHPYKSAAP